jgi:hypothetical protein
VGLRDDAEAGPVRALDIAVRVMLVCFVIAWWLDFVGLVDVGWGPA